METNPFAPKFDDLPESLPIFPLGGVMLLPGGQLPLNIFEPRYVAMVNDVLTAGRMIGMVQPVEEGADEVYKIGCAGKITEFSETADGRYEIKLTGIIRFRILKELKEKNGYRRVKPSWLNFESDLESAACLDLDRDKLKSLLKCYFEKEGMDCDWNAVDGASDGKLMTCLAMACPMAPREKQALLEAGCGHTRAQMFMDLLEMAVHGREGCANKH